MLTLLWAPGSKQELGCCGQFTIGSNKGSGMVLMHSAVCWRWAHAKLMAGPELELCGGKPASSWCQVSACSQSCPASSGSLWRMDA